jgi:hypothetical protein
MSTEHDNVSRSSGAGGASEEESGHALASTLLNEGNSASGTSSAQVDKPDLTAAGEPVPRENVNLDIPPKSPKFRADDVLSPAATDRVFPVRSVISVQPTPPIATPSTARPGQTEGYFPSYASRSGSASTSESSHRSGSMKNQKGGRSNWDRANERHEKNERNRKASGTGANGPEIRSNLGASSPIRQPPDVLASMLTGQDDDGHSMGAGSTATSGANASAYAASTRSNDETGPLLTARFRHIVTEGGHAVITGRDGETLQRCEDEPIHIPGAVQGFGLLIALEEQAESKLVVRVVSENSKKLIGYTPKQLFALDSFTDILSDEQRYAICEDTLTELNVR